MTLYAPHLLPKIRSPEIMRAVGHYDGHGNLVPGCMPCTLRIASLVGQQCAGRDTSVGAHTGRIGKGMSTKVSDLNIVAACYVCHALYDRVLTGWGKLYDDTALKCQMLLRVIDGRDETQAMLLDMGLIVVPGAEVI